MDDEIAEDELVDPEDLESLAVREIDLDEADLEEADFEGLEDDLGVELEDDLVGDAVEIPEDDEIEIVPISVVVEEDDDDDDDVDPDDVEASLDVILKDRLVIEDVEDDEDDDTPDVDDRSEGNSLVVPKRPDEFLCQSCFLVKHPSQLANSVQQLCRDCV